MNSENSLPILSSQISPAYGIGPARQILIVAGRQVHHRIGTVARGGIDGRLDLVRGRVQWDFEDCAAMISSQSRQGREGCGDAAGAPWCRRW